MKLSIFTTVTNPTSRGDNFEDAINCYRELADEIIIVDGSSSRKVGLYQTPVQSVKWLYHEWPFEFNWPFIGEQFQRGYEAATGDWVIHADIDFLFHEKNFKQIREVMEANPDAPALSFWKWQFILPDRYNLKSRLVIAVNKKKYGDRIKFNSGGDLCQPSLDGQELKSDDCLEARVPLYNYEKMLKNYDQVLEDVARMARAWHQYWGEPRLGANPEEAFDEWARMMTGRFQKPQEFLPLNGHPKFVQKSIDSLTEKQWGFNGFGLLNEINQYALGNMRG